MDKKDSGQLPRAYLVAAWILAAVFVCAGAVALLPALRNAIIRLAEVCLVHRPLVPAPWHRRLVRWSLMAMLWCVTAALSLLALRHRKEMLDAIDKNETLFVRVLYGFAAVNIAIICSALVNQSIWADEACTLSQIRMPYKEMLRTIKIDVHGPPYFFITKFLVDSVHLIAKGASTVTTAKVCSIIPIILMIPLAATKVRRNWGRLCGAFFAVCATGMPQIMHYAVEIRMYSWLMLFVTLTFLFAYDCAMFCLPPPPDKHAKKLGVAYDMRGGVLLHALLWSGVGGSYLCRTSSMAVH